MFTEEKKNNLREFKFSQNVFICNFGSYIIIQMQNEIQSDEKFLKKKEGKIKT